MKGVLEKRGSPLAGFLDELEKLAKEAEDTPGADAEPAAIPGMKKGVQLYNHQTGAVDKIERTGSLLLSHGTGSGKTITALAGFEKLRANGEADRALVVTPASLRVNFIDNGVKKFTTGRVAMLGNKQEVDAGVARSVDNPDPGARYHVISYEMFMKDPQKVLENTRADTVIYDELHRIRNEEGVTYGKLREARKLHKNFIGLTGSLMNNTPADLVPLVDAMTDGQHRLGTKAQFERRFVKEDPKSHEKTIAKPYMVKALLAPFVDHFETRDMQDERMPKKIVQEVKVMMSPYQEELYRYAINKMDPVTAIKFRLGVTKLKSRDLQNIFSQITQARQVSNAIHTLDLDETMSGSARKSPKVKQLLDDVEEHIRETPDAQVVIHSNLIKGGVDVLSQGLKDRNIGFGTFVGKGQPGVSEEKRQQAVKDFNAGKNKVIVISAAGGEGLDLKNATLFSSLDGHFNPEKVQQAEARAIRAGGLAHRDPEDRRVIVKRYQSVVPRSVTQAVKDVMQLISPSTFMQRVSDPSAPLFFNPFKRERSPDEWMSEVANRKNVLNEAFRSQLRKTSSVGPDLCEYESAELPLDRCEQEIVKIAAADAFEDEMLKVAAESAAQKIPFQPYKFIKSDKHIMERYWDHFGPDVEKMNDPLMGELPGKADRVKEQEMIEALRSYYREAAKTEGNSGKAPKGVNTDKDVIKDKLKNLALVGGISAGYGGLLGAARTAPMMAGSANFGKNVAIGAGIGALATTALMGAITIPATIMSLRNPYFTTQKTKAKKAVGLEDTQLRALLRGLSVTEEQVKKTEHFIEA